MGRPPLGPRAIAAAAAVGVIAGAAELQRRHRRAIARDEDYRRLRRPFSSARFLNHPRAGRMALGSRAPVPAFSTPPQQAMIRYTAFGPGASRGDVAFYERLLVDCPPDVRAATGHMSPPERPRELCDAVTRLIREPTTARAAVRGL